MLENLCPLRHGGFLNVEEKGHVYSSDGFSYIISISLYCFLVFIKWGLSFDKLHGYTVHQ